MIMEWKKQSDGTHQGIWRGIHLVLLTDPVNNRCHMTADGVLVRQNWPSVRKAMDDIDRKQNRVVVQASRALQESVGAVQCH